MSDTVPTKILLKKKSKKLVIFFSPSLNQTDFIVSPGSTEGPSSAQKDNQSDHNPVQSELSAEFLRVHSPSAEVRRHGNPILVTGKKDVGIDHIAYVGRYGIQIFFDDDHTTGIYTWRYLAELSINQTWMWQNYLQSLHDKHLTREPDTQVVRLHQPTHKTGDPNT